MLSEPIMVRNTLEGPLVFSNTPNDHVEWQGAGDAMGGDVQPVTPDWVNNPNFRRMMSRGIVEIEEATEEITTILDKHKADWAQRQADRENASTSSIDQAPNNDMVVKKCLGPGVRANEGCTVDVSQKVQDVDKKPPLCAQHAHLAGNFVPEATERIVNGKQEVVWKSIKMGPRATQES